MTEPVYTRRRVLRAGGSGLAVASLATLGAGKVGATQPTDETVPVNVGYASQSGRDAVLTRASTVHYEFGFDALTVQMPASAMDALAARRDTRYVEENRALSSDRHTAAPAATAGQRTTSPVWYLRDGR